MAAPKNRPAVFPTEGPVEGTDPEVDAPVVPPTQPTKVELPIRTKPLPVASHPAAKPLPILPDVVGSHSDEGSLPVVTAEDGRKVALLLPQYKQTNPLTLYSLMVSRDRKEMGMLMSYGDGFIIHSRNVLAHRFIEETNFEWALFVDDDMILPCGKAGWFKHVTGWDVPDSLAGVKTVERLMSHGKPLVGALYFGRSHHGQGKPMFAEGFHNKEVAKEARNVRASARGIRATGWVGTGCLLVHRSVFTAIRDRFPYLRPDDPKEAIRYFSPAADGALTRLHAAESALLSGDVERAKKLLAEANSPAAMAHAWSGEDVTFCTRARMVGIQPHVDLGTVCGHVGSAVWGPTNTV